MSQNESRVKKTLLNAKVDMLFYIVNLIISFYSRKVFLDCLSADFVGLTGTLGNIMGYLNLADLGIGAAIGFNLFKPLQEGNKEELNRLISLYGYYYRNIGLFVLGAGIVISLFFPLIFSDANFPLLLIYFIFFSYLGSSLIGYFINYKATLLFSDQKGYIFAAYSQTANTIRVLVQIVVVQYFMNYYLWMAVEVFFSLLNAIVLNRKIYKTYPWLNCSVKLGKEASPNYPNIRKSSNQVFIHKLKDFALTQSDQLFIFMFVSLKMVAYYGNYTILIAKTCSVFNIILGSVGASIGNLVAEGNKHKILSVFWELNAIRYFSAGIVCFCYYQLAPSFITLWLGPEYVLSKTILILLLVNQFIYITRGSVDSFNHAYGHYADVWTAWVEGIITVGGTLLFGWLWGIEGILFTKSITLLTIVLIWKPYYLYRDGFKNTHISYWSGTSRYYIVLAGCWILSTLISKIISINPAESYLSWVFYAILISFPFALLLGTGIVIFCPGGKEIINRLPINKIKLTYAKIVNNNN